MTNEHNCAAIKFRYTSYYGTIIAKGAITMQFEKVLAH
jgi:hypothetical protein